MHFSKFPILLSLILSFSAGAQDLSDYEKANQAFELGNIDESYIHLKNSLNENQEHLPSKILMGHILGLSGYFSEAELELMQAISSGADKNLVIEPLINVLIAQSKFEAIIDLSARQLNEANRGLLLSAKGLSYNAIGQTDESDAAHREAVKLAPNNANILNAYAYFLVDQSQSSDAAKYIELSKIIDDKNPSTLMIEASIFQAQGDTKAATQSLKTALGFAPTHPVILRELVASLSKQGEYAEAKEIIEKTLELSPNDPVGQLLLSWVASKLEDNELAGTTLDGLINNLSLLDDKALDNNEELLFINGMANYARNNLEAAKDSLNQYLFKRPGNLQAAQILVDIYKAEQNYTGAIGVLENYQNIMDDDLPLAMSMCDLYILAGLNHKCVWLMSRLEPDFKNEQSYIEMGARLLAARGKIDLALNKLDEITTPSISTLLQKAILSIRSDSYESADKYISRLEEELPTDTGVKNLRASYYLKTQQGQLAENLYQEILSISPEHYEARFNLANKMYNEGRSEEARRIVDGLYEERPNNLEVLTMYGRILMQTDNNEKALEVLKKADDISPENLAVKEALIDTYVRLLDFDDALYEVNTLIKSDFLNPRYISKRAELYMRSGQNDKAREDFQTLFGLYSERVSDLYQLSLDQSRIGDARGVIRTLDRVLELEPNNYFAQRDKAKVLVATKQLAQAEGVIQALASKYAQEADISLLQADLQLAKGNKTQASNFYIESLNRESQLAPALIMSYQLALEGINELGFVKKFATLAKDTSENTFASHLLADYYSQRNKTSDAKSLYVSISKEANYVALPMVLNNLANIYIEEDKVDAAHNFATQAFEALPENQAILDTMGWVAALQGNYDYALDLLRRSFAMNASDTSVRYHLAFTLDKLQRKDEAKKELDTLLSNFSEFKYRAQAEALREALN